MKFVDHNRDAILACITVAILVGCVSQAQIGASSGIPPSSFEQESVRSGVSATATQARRAQHVVQNAVGFIYVANSSPSANSVSAYTYDATGVLSSVNGSPFPAGLGPSAVAISPSGKFLYAGNNGNCGSGAVSGYRIEAKNGALKPIKGSPFEAGSCPYGVAADPKHKFLYVAFAGYFNNGVSGYAILANGTLQQVPGSPFGDPDGTADGIAIDPSGKFLYVCNYDSANVSAYSINASGALTTVKGSPFPAGAYPSAVAVDPKGKHVYVINGYAKTVSAYSINAVSGALTPVAGSPFGPTGGYPFAVAVDPNDDFTYIPNYYDSTVSAFKIRRNGGLKSVAGSPFATGNEPDGVALDPEGKFVYVANGGNNNISAYTVNRKSGGLTPVAGSPFASGNYPEGIATCRLVSGTCKPGSL